MHERDKIWFREGLEVGDDEFGNEVGWKSGEVEASEERRDAGCTVFQLCSFRVRAVLGDASR